MRRTALILLALALLSSCDRQPVRPNVVFILADDLGWADLGCYGSVFHESPNIDQLAAGSLRFTQAYAACPVCSPTRASIMTGKYPVRTGITDWIPGRQQWNAGLPSDRVLAREFEHQLAHAELSLAEAMKEEGYHTFFAGKWHLGEDSAYWPEHQGFDHNFGGWKAGGPYGGGKYFSPYGNPRLEDGPKGEHLADRLTGEAIRFIEEHTEAYAGPSGEQAEEPFFVYLSYYSVHTPLMAKEELVAKYRKKALRMGLVQDSLLNADAAWIDQAPPTGHYLERTGQGHATYAAMIETLDTNVGRLATSLKTLGIWDNTIIIFMSDNGGLSTSEGSPTSNAPLRAGKGWMYEGGIREPMLIRWPGSASVGRTCDHPVTSTDFYPTILELCGLEARPAQHVDGLSLVPLLKGEELKERPLFWHYPHIPNQGARPAAAVRQGAYKLIEFLDNGELELYDLDRDIGETRNLVMKMPDKGKEMLEVLHSWQEETGAEGMDLNPAWDPEYSRSAYLKTKNTNKQAK